LQVDEVSLMSGRYPSQPHRAEAELKGADAVLIVFVDSFKGGVGKTTTARWLARSLTNIGGRVLLTGLSVQNDIYPGVPIGVDGLREALFGRLTKAIHCQEGLYVWPAGVAEPGPVEIGRFGSAVADKAVEVGADWVVIDGANFLSQLSWAAVGIADQIVVPAGLRIEQVFAGLKTLRAISTTQAGGTGKARLLLTHVPSPSARTRGEEGLLTAVRQDYGHQLFDAEIRYCRRYEDFAIPAASRPDVIQALGGNLLATDYAALTREIVDALGAVTTQVTP
jgi:cellulose biosynthesis protein BcsQ